MKRFWKRPVVAAVAASMAITSAVPAMGMDGDTNTAVVAEAYEDDTDEKTDESENKTETYTQETEDEENITVMSAPEEEGFVIENGVLTSYTGTAEEITIPDTVTTVGDGENGFLSGNESVKKVIIGSSVEPLCSYITTVTADRETRILRIMKRDGISRADAEKRIDAQQSDDFYIAHSDFVIQNNDLTTLKAQAENILNQIRKKESGI